MWRAFVMTKSSKDASVHEYYNKEMSALHEIYLIDRAAKHQGLSYSFTQIPQLFHLHVKAQ